MERELDPVLDRQRPEKIEELLVLVVLVVALALVDVPERA
jgi:hypothetical protein